MGVGARVRAWETGKGIPIGHTGACGNLAPPAPDSRSCVFACPGCILNGVHIPTLEVDAVFEIGSVTKPFAAAAVLQLAREGRVVGGEGLGIQIENASGNRIIDNQISAIRRRNPFPGLTWGDDPNRWRDANGSAIWISGGSDENLVAGNTFTEIEGTEVHVAGDRNDIRVSDPRAVVRDEGQGNRIHAP